MLFLKRMVLIVTLLFSAYVNAECSSHGVIVNIVSNSDNDHVYFYLDGKSPREGTELLQATNIRLKVKNVQLIDTLLKARLANKPIKVTMGGDCSEVHIYNPKSSYSFMSFQDESGLSLNNSVAISEITIMEDYYPQNN